jgi:hypothetical protein
MRRAPDNAQRALRLLRWYPLSWRERYGEEFLDHLEQEFEDRPRSIKRSVNVVRKGLVARLGDIGLANSVATPGVQPRAALGTSVALVALMLVVMVNFWSRSMLTWSSRRYHPIPVSATTGTLTVVVALIVLILAAIVVAMVICAVRQMIRGRGRRLVVPLALAAGSGALLLYAARYVPRFLSPYIHGAHGLQGMSLSRPGQLIANLAQVTWQTTQQWVDPWNRVTAPISTVQGLVDDFVPIALFVFGVAIALLIRRVEIPQGIARLAFPVLAFLGALTGVFFVAYLAWNLFGGPSNFDLFFRDSWLGIVYRILLGVVALLVGRSAMVATGSRPRTSRNQIDIVSSRAGGEYPSS